MSEDEYTEMEKALDAFSIKGDGYEIGAWNDASGYDYWSAEGEDTNYIQVTVYVDKDKISSIDPQALKDHVKKAESEMQEWENI